MTTPTINDQLKGQALDLTQEYPASPRTTLGGFVLAQRCVDKCRAVLAGTEGEYHFDCPLDNMFLGFAGIQADDLKEFVATGADNAAVGKWIEEHATKRPRIELIKWNNEFRYKRLSELPDNLQEFMEDYIPENVPAKLLPEIDYFFDVFDAEEKRLG
jgi:hypothetical protein